MSPVKRTTRVLAVGCALLAVIAVGCSKKNGAPFDPDAGHSADFFPTHPAEYRSALESCDRCHGTDLSGGISAVSCYSAARDGQSCHPGGPGGHPAGWRALHSADPSKAATCAPCHDNKDNNQAPNCFDNSLCHGPKSGHPAGWRKTHTGTNPSQASYCADCHDNPANSRPPDCFNNSLCHGAKSSHPAGWRTAHRSTVSGNAEVCAGCHAAKGTPSCFYVSACHGGINPHGSGWKDQHETQASQAATCYNCHIKKSGTPNCFNNTLCHGPKGD